MPRMRFVWSLLLPSNQLPQDICCGPRIDVDNTWVPMKRILFIYLNSTKLTQLHHTSYLLILTQSWLRRVWLHVCVLQHVCDTFIFLSSFTIGEYIRRSAKCTESHNLSTSFKSFSQRSCCYLPFLAMFKQQLAVVRVGSQPVEWQSWYWNSSGPIRWT